MNHPEAPPPDRYAARRTWVVALVLAGTLAFMATRLGTHAPPPAVADHTAQLVAEAPPRAPLRDDDLAPLADALRAAWHNEAEAPPPDALANPGAVYLVARQSGLKQAEGWRHGPHTGNAMIELALELREAAGSQRVDTLEVVLAHGFTTLNPSEQGRHFTNVHRGLRGLELVGPSGVTRFAPTEMIATNRDFRRTIKVWSERSGTAAGSPLPDTHTVRLFDADQLIVPLAADAPVQRMYRGNRVTDVAQITQTEVQRLADLHAGWLFRNLHSDGRQTYKYWPSSGKESDGNNMIRQWMATVAMVRVAQRGADPTKWDRINANIRYNLGAFYEEDGDLGLIVEAGTKVKLGAVALAALSMLEHKDRQAWRATEDALFRTTMHLWQPDGSFRTFYRPDRNDNHNFYPGEALLYWAFRYEAEPDPELLRRFMASYRYYREWHLNNRNPAFIPWHTQAYVKMWQKTKDPSLAEWVFEMNDWLLDVQQWDEQERFPDTMGRFYDPRRPFGPPHASSTGVYLEGLIDAWKLAQDLGDEDRAESYRRAMVRALRSVHQLTFKDDLDMFYISRRELVRGGVRTTVYDNEIRVDNVQHNLMGILKILDTLPNDAFRP